MKAIITQRGYTLSPGSCSVTQLCPTRLTPWTAARQASLSITNSWSLLKLMSIKSVMPSNHLILCHPHLLLPSMFPSTRVFSNESVLHIRWLKYWSFSFSVSPSNEYSGLISFRNMNPDNCNGRFLGVEQSNSVIRRHVLFFLEFFSHLGCYKVSSRVSCDVQCILVGCLF